MTQSSLEVFHAYCDALQHGDMKTLLAIAAENIVLEGRHFYLQLTFVVIIFFLYRSQKRLHLKLRTFHISV